MCYKFVQIVYKYQIPAIPKAVLLALAFKKNPKDNRCFPSWTTLQEMTGLSRRSIANGIKWLTDNGVITHKTLGTGKNCIKQYQINRKWEPDKGCRRCTGGVHNLQVNGAGDAPNKKLKEVKRKGLALTLVKNHLDTG